MRTHAASARPGLAGDLRSSQRRHARPTTGTERALVEVLAEVVETDRVSPESHFFDDLGADSMVMARFCARVRKRGDLPPISIKDVYRHPTISNLATALAPPSAPPVEEGLAEVLADVLQVDRVSPESHFFDDLGADSMVMARFCARVRKRSDLPAVSIKDVYEHPTIRGLAAALAPPSSPAQAPAAAAVEPPTRVTTLQYVACGTLQALFFVGYSLLAALAVKEGFEWIAAGGALIDDYLRSVVVGGVVFLGTCLLPVLAKWVLVGRWKPQQIRVWSLAYVRFWIVKTLIRSNPLVLLTGGRSHTSSSSPLHVLYLRSLGAKIGRGVAIFSRSVPVCTDLLTVGDGTVIRKDSFFTCYRVQGGMLQTGSVTLGRDVFVGEMTVLDIDTAMGDGAQLGHASALQAGQAVPGGECWQGSPARRVEGDYRMAGGTELSTRRTAVYGVLQILNALFVTLPLAFGGVAMLLVELPQLAALLDAGPLALTTWTFYVDALVASALLFVGFVVVGLAVVVTVPRVLALALEPDRVYPLYGFHYGIHRMIARLTNPRFFAFLFGDSSYITHYLQWLGYDLSEVEQTGSNFGTRLKHETPFLARVGSGTMVADGLSIINADFSNTSFRLSRVAIGPRNFLGNNIAYPSHGRTGDNCLLATKVAVPVTGEVREGVGLLGSPHFEIPRTVQRDSRVAGLVTGDDTRRRLSAKNRHNLVTMALYLLVRWFQVLLVTLLAAAAVDLYHSAGAWAIAVANVSLLLVSVAYWVLVERSLEGLQALRPQGCSIYERSFWRHERFWKVPAWSYLQVFNGTPFKGVVWRMLGVRIGKRVFDDGCGIVEKTFVSIGDDCTLNAGSIIQCHSQEDGAFKSDRSEIGSGCTLGVGAFVHYGVRMGDDSTLEADSFLMKGEEVPPHTRWGGNPAVAVGTPHAGVGRARAGARA